MEYYHYETDSMKPVISNEKTINLANKIAKIYEYSCVGSNCHIVVDDSNVEDEHITWCLDQLSLNYHESTEEQLKLEREVLELFLELTEEERHSAIELTEEKKYSTI